MCAFNGNVFVRCSWLNAECSFCDIDNILKIWYNICVKILQGKMRKCKVMIRTFKLKLLVCLLLFANLFTLTSCFMEFSEEQHTPSTPSAPSEPFTTLTYTGTGCKIIKDIDVPNGKFIISGYATLNDDDPYAYGSFDVFLKRSNGLSDISWWCTLSSDRKTVEKADFFNGDTIGLILEIQAEDDISWTITIEAAG